MFASFARIIGFFTITAGAAAAVLLGAGFCWFVLKVPTEEVTFDRKADGVLQELSIRRNRKPEQ